MRVVSALFPPEELAAGAPGRALGYVHEPPGNPFG
jgi:hypothetical protein